MVSTSCVQVRPEELHRKSPCQPPPTTFPTISPHGLNKFVLLP